MHRITLNTMTLNVKSDKVYTRHGVPISVTGIAQVDINSCSRKTCFFSFLLLFSFSSADV